MKALRLHNTRPGEVEQAERSRGVSKRTNQKVQFQVVWYTGSLFKHIVHFCWIALIYIWSYMCKSWCFPSTDDLNCSPWSCFTCVPLMQRVPSLPIDSCTSLCARMCLLPLSLVTSLHSVWQIVWRRLCYFISCCKMAHRCFFSAPLFFIVCLRLCVFMLAFGCNRVSRGY